MRRIHLRPCDHRAPYGALRRASLRPCVQPVLGAAARRLALLSRCHRRSREPCVDTDARSGHLMSWNGGDARCPRWGACPTISRGISRRRRCGNAQRYSERVLRAGRPTGASLRRYRFERARHSAPCRRATAGRRKRQRTGGPCPNARLRKARRRCEQRGPALDAWCSVCACAMLGHWAGVAVGSQRCGLMAASLGQFDAGLVVSQRKMGRGRCCATQRRPRRRLRVVFRHCRSGDAYADTLTGSEARVLGRRWGRPVRPILV